MFLPCEERGEIRERDREREVNPYSSTNEELRESTFHLFSPNANRATSPGLHRRYFEACSNPRLVEVLALLFDFFLCVFVFALRLVGVGDAEREGGREAEGERERNEAFSW